MKQKPILLTQRLPSSTMLSGLPSEISPCAAPFFGMSETSQWEENQHMARYMFAFRHSLTTDVVSRACIWVTVGAGKVQLEPVALVGDQIGVAIRDLTLGDLREERNQYDQRPAE